MDKTQSTTINYLRFILIIAVIILHAYTVTLGVEWLKSGHPLYKFLGYNLSLHFGNIGVPFFFFISGYLFFYSGKPNYFQKLKSRFHSLVIPYLLWNTLTILLFYLMQQIPFTESFFSGVNKAVGNYSFLDFLRAFGDNGNWDFGNGKPILPTYWYIRNLIVLAILSPLIYAFNYYLKIYWLLPIGLAWLLTPHMALVYCSIFAFGTGAYLGLNQTDIKLSGKWFKAGWIVCLCLLGILNYNIYYPVNSIISVAALRLFIICAIPVIYTVVYHLVNRGWKLPSKMVDSAFFIYSFHFFFIMALLKYEFKLFPAASDGLSVLFYLSSIIITFYISYGVYCLARKLTPKLLALLCGDRC